MTVPDRAELGPSTAAYVKAMGWRSVNAHTHISLVNRYVYVEVPKAGCGTMKATLGGLEAARLSSKLVERVQAAPHDRTKVTPFVKPFQLPPAQLEEVFTSTQFKRFAVVRDPAARLLSGYLEKIRQGLQQSSPIFETLAAQGRAPKSAADISFADFIDVIGAQASRDQDPHWRRQVDHLGIPDMQYDALIHLEQLGESWHQIGELISVPDVQEQFFCRNSTQADAHLAENYTPELLAKVAEIYAGDYAALNYPVE
ncbi:MAG: hypothetical protein EXQ60_03105 [Candidatus Nanopelagicales bacterium]|nr:hypothetical protein [Candidatus Nanopelagicales bacterium]